MNARLTLYYDVEITLTHQEEKKLLDVLTEAAQLVKGGTEHPEFVAEFRQKLQNLRG